MVRSTQGSFAKGIRPVYLGSFCAANKRCFSALPKDVEAEARLKSNLELINDSEKLGKISVKGRLVDPEHQRKVGVWLLIVAGAVFGMIVLGGYTRLTKSGLSMTRWKPIQSKYPGSEQAWEEEFEHYKVNRG